MNDPYKGLSAFDATELDALLFFGRGHETEVVVANALASRLTVLYGPSGVGKSSLLRAGVVQALRGLSDEDAVAVAYFSTWAGDAATGLEAAARGALADVAGGDPGDAPGTLADRLEAWTSALGCELCLVLDQFEEAFLYDDGDDLVDLLPELVTRPGLKVNVVLGIRDDQLARLDVFKARIPALFSNYLRLDRLDRQSARAAILGPLDRYNESAAEDARVTIEPALVEAILAQVASGRIEAAAVDADRIEAPYLQLVLQRLWEVERERRSQVLHAETLTELGGAQRIVETHLERAMSALTPAQQDVAAEMFEHLVTPSGSKIAHAMSDLATFAHVDEGQLEPVLSSLANQRIVRPTGTNGHAGMYEIYHDVLTGAVLDWRARHEADAALARERDASHRRQRRLAAVAGGSLVLIVVLAVLTAFAFSQRSSARREQRRTEASGLLQHADALLAVDPVAAIRSALQSAAIAKSADTESVLRSALLATNAELDLRASAPASTGAYSPNGTMFALGDRGGQVGIFRLPDGRRLATLHTGSPLNAVAFSPNSRFVATGGRDGRVRLWDLRAPGSPARTLPHGAPVLSLAYSPDGTRLVSAGGDSAKLWNPITGRVVQTLGHARLVRRASFNKDGSLVLTVSRDRTANVWDAATGRVVSRLRQQSEITDAAFGPNGLVVTGARDGIGAIWDARTGRRRAWLIGHTSQILSVAFSPAGDVVATGSVDGTSRVWRLDGRLVDIERVKRSSIVSVSFSPDGQSLVSASSDGSATTSGFFQETQSLYGQPGPMQSAFFAPDGMTVATVSGTTARLWEPYGEPVLREISKRPGAATSAAFDPGGTMLAVGGVDGRVVVEPAEGGHAIKQFDLGTPVTTVAWGDNGLLLAAGRRGVVDIVDGSSWRTERVIHSDSPLVAAALRADGRVAAGAGTDGVVRIWDTATGRVLLRLAPLDRLGAVALDPTGRLVAAASGKDVVVFAAASGKRLALLHGHTDTVTGLAFSRDGSRLVSSSVDHDARLWNTSTFGLVKVLHRHASFVSGVAFTTDGRWIATAGPLKAGVWETFGTDLPGSFLFFVRGNASPITSVAFSSRRDELATTARDGTTRVFDCQLCSSLPELEQYARERLQRLGG